MKVRSCDTAFVVGRVLAWEELSGTVVHSERSIHSIDPSATAWSEMGEHFYPESVRRSLRELILTFPSWVWTA